MPVPLRPFQQQLERDIYAAWQSGATNVMAVAATGSGKTVVISKIHYDEPGASIAIAHRRELVSQIAGAFASNGVRFRIAGAKKGSPLIKVINALQVAEFGYSFFDPNSKVGVGGVDTVVGMDPADPWLQQVRLCTQDEAHHVLKLNKWGRAHALFPNARGLLPTATPKRADGKGLGRHADGLVDAMVLAPSMRDIINMGYLTDYRIYAPPCADLNLEGVAVGDSGDFVQAQLRKAVHASHITGDVVAHYLKYARGKLGVTFAVDVEAAGEIAAAFRTAGVPAEVVTADTPDTLRASIIRRFKGREILQLVNVDLFGEGFDLPALEVVSFARPTESFALYSQQFGRVLRLMIPKELLKVWDTLSDGERRARIAASGKPFGIIIDHVGNVIRHMGPPDRRIEWSLDRRERRASSKSDAIPLRTCISWTDAEGTKYEGCVQPFERVHKDCPYCGCPTPPPALRSAPEYVDGDLSEYSPELLAAMRGDIDRISGDFMAPRGMPWDTQAHARRNHDARRDAHNALRNSIAWWAGLEHAQGRSESESYRRFYFKFGTDVASCQTVSASEARALTERVNLELAKFSIDGTVNAGAYFAGSQN